MKLKVWLKGKNRAEFAKKIGISKTYLDQVCVHIRRPSPEVAKRIQFATNGQVRILELLFPDGSHLPTSKQKKSA